MIKEACVGNFESALKAEYLGADQIELCDRLDLDGISPSLTTVKKVSQNLSIPVKVIINPKPFDYIYSEYDLQKIISYVQDLNNLSIDGIVFGPLTQNNLPDLKAINHISKFTPLPITYHKAIDETHNIIESVKLLRDQGIVKFILSSGGKSTAIEGLQQLQLMKKLVNGSHLQIIAAGKITSENVETLHDKLQFSYYHGKKIVGDLET